MKANFFVEAIEKTARDRLFLVRGADKGKPCWKYLLSSPSRASMVAGLAMALPLKLKLEDYGQVVYYGDGEMPPAYVSKNIALSDLKAESPSAQTEVFCFMSRDNSGDEFFTYLEVPYFMLEKFNAISSQGKPFDFTEYGEILHSGWGKPDEDVVRMMKEKYNINTPDEVIAA